ncbi:MAG TPA: hypothetical protein VMT16_11030 [Thermoanaerobaculia bacterium]|nr:hypothetical protein [Thermoanaerobaculia bacterium]
MPELRVQNVRRESAGGSQTLTADFLLGGRKQRVWLRTDDGPISATANPFVPIALIPAMRRNWGLSIDGGVSSRLLEGADQVQETLTRWYPRLHRVSIRAAAEEPRPARQQRPVALFFSGGVDSFFTLRQHREEITHLIFVHGFDIPLGRRRERRRMRESIGCLAASLDLQLVEVDTNLRQFGQPHVSWPGEYFGAGLAAVALLLEPRFERVYLAASVSSEQLQPMGSHPDLDPHWTDGSVRLVHDGLRATRFEKVRAIADWPPVHSHLRVCYQKNARALNCGRCKKCLWTMMILSASGHLDRIETFATPLDLAALRLYPPVHKYERDRFVEALALLAERDGDPRLRATLQAMLDAEGRLPLRGRINRILVRGRNYLAHRFPARRRGE